MTTKPSLEDTEEKTVFHLSGEKGEIKFCKKCQATQHYCLIFKTRPDVKGCLFYYWEKSRFPDGKTLKWFIHFNAEELEQNRHYTTEEFCLKYYGRRI